MKVLLVLLCVFPILIISFGGCGEQAVFNNGSPREDDPCKPTETDTMKRIRVFADFCNNSYDGGPTEFAYHRGNLSDEDLQAGLSYLFVHDASSFIRLGSIVGLRTYGYVRDVSDILRYRNNIETNQVIRSEINSALKEIENSEIHY